MTEKISMFDLSADESLNAICHAKFGIWILL